MEPYSQKCFSLVNTLRKLTPIFELQTEITIYDDMNITTGQL